MNGGKAYQYLCIRERKWKKRGINKEEGYYCCERLIREDTKEQIKKDNGREEDVTEKPSRFQEGIVYN